MLLLLLLLCALLSDCGMCVLFWGMWSHDDRSHASLLFQIVFVLSIFLFLSLSLYLFLTLSSLKPPAK